MLGSGVLDTVGNTPLVRLNVQLEVELFAKLEFCNPMGSLKDRAAAYALERLVAAGKVTRDTWVVESSSGNFGVALAAYSRRHGLRFRCVVDPRISPENEAIIRSLGATVVKVHERDTTGGYLLTRLAEVRRFLVEEPSAYWTNQYENPLIAEAYNQTLGGELVEAFDHLDYAFVPVSSGGTIAGLSTRLKEAFPACRIVAVDCEGSLIFGSSPRPRFIPGIGSSMVPPILARAKIDDVVIVDETRAIEACHALLLDHGIFAGGSSGFVLAAITRYFAENPPVGRRPNVVALFPDRGERYTSTVYDAEWCAQLRAGDVVDAKDARA